VRRAATPFELKEALQGAFVYDDEVLVEKEIVGIQVEYAVMGNDFLRIAPSCEILNRGFHDFASKYGPTASGYAIPARIPPFLDALGRSLALTMYQASGCQGIARVDFFVDESGHFWLNEINPFPGYTPTSAYPAMWNGAGMEIGAQCDEMVLLALHRHRKGKRIRGR
jgi:D-alanine--D-alanine ligase